MHNPNLPPSLAQYSHSKLTFPSTGATPNSGSGPSLCECDGDAIPCEACAEAQEKERAWMAPLAKRNVESKRAGLGPIAAGLVYDTPEELDWQFNELKEADHA